LANANETINFLSTLTGKDPSMIKKNLANAMNSNGTATAGAAGGGPGGPGGHGDVCSHCNGTGAA